MPQVWDVDVASGRLLVREGTGAGMRLVVLHKNSAALREVLVAPRAWGRLLPGAAVLFGPGDGRVLATIGDEPPHEVVKLAGSVIAAAELGPNRFVAISDSGELVRGNVDTGEIDRQQTPADAVTFLARDAANHALIIEDNRILLWDQRLEQIAQLDRPISSIAPVDGGLLITLRDHETQFFSMQTRKVERRLLPPAALDPTTSFDGRLLPPAALDPTTSFDGRLLVGTGRSGALSLVELPAQVHWDLPAWTGTMGGVAVSPSARRIVQFGLDGMVMWQLPAAGGDFAAWLDEQTTATKGVDDVLAWPWQLPRVR